MSNENGDTTVRRAVDFESLDLYQRLGVERTASVVEINKSYKKLALQYHPDRNFGSAEAESAIKVINEAYEVLSDPNKRRQYDLSNGSLDSMNQIDSLDMANLGQLGRVFGAMAGKMGIPIPTSISQDTLTKAQEICQNEPGLCEDNKFLMPLKLGVTYSGNVNRQQGLFYLLRVSKEVSDLGLALRCRSSNKSRFKLVVFDSKGSVRYQEESIRSSGCTSCTIYFTPFEVGYLADRLPLSSSEDSVPPIFHRLSTFQLTQRRLEAGDHLVCVYGDNFLRGANFSLTAIAISPKTEIIQCAMQQADQALLTKREELQAFQSEYMETRKAWEEVQAKLQRHTESVDCMISQREAACDEFLRISLEECEPPEESARSVNVQQVMRSRERGPPNSFNKDSGEAGVLSYPDTAEMTWSQFSRSMGSLFGGKR